jgi:flavin-dependent dehydrogenase
MRPAPDVLIIGGGPAGASTAFQLARRGIRVRVLERARFPRAKPCAECLSPQASRLLHDMGVLGELESRGAWLRGMTVRSPNGTLARGDYAAGHGFRAFRDRGLAIRREVLDEALLASARMAGGEVEEGPRCVDVLRGSSGAVSGVRVLRGSRVDDVRAQVVIGADGLRSVIARRLGLARTLAWPARLALVAHYRDVEGISAYGEMHIERDGFVGIADVGGGVTTVAAVFPLTRAREISGDRSRFLDVWLASKAHLAARFRRATRDGDARAVGPFASHARRASHPQGGALLVGDAADFFDPFTGEGIYAALRGGEMAADAVAGSLDVMPRRRAEALEEYESRRRSEFRGKWRVERLIGIGVAFPPIANRATRALAARKELADLLVGVTGDFVPPSRVLRPNYLASLFLAPLPTTPSTPWP